MTIGEVRKAYLLARRLKLSGWWLLRDLVRSARECNGIGPGYIATPQTAPLREIQPDGSRHPFDQFIVAKTPAERWGDPEDLGGPAVFLASDASNFVNGHVLYVDGGILAYIGKQP